MTMMQRPVVLVTDDTTTADLIETLVHLNADAKAMRRRGWIGYMSADYARQHERIDALLEELEARG